VSTKLLVESIDVSTRRKRRVAISLAIDILEKVRSAEDAYLSNQPINFHESDSYAIAENAHDSLVDIIVSLSDVYE